MVADLVFNQTNLMEFKATAFVIDERFHIFLTTGSGDGEIQLQLSYSL